MISPTSSRSSSPDHIGAEDLWTDCAARVDPNLGNRAFDNAERLSCQVERTQKAVTETVKNYGQAIAEGALEGTQAMIQGVVGQVLHPIDRVVKPVAEILHDIGLAGGWQRTGIDICFNNTGPEIKKVDLETGPFRDPFSAPYTELSIMDSTPSILAEWRMQDKISTLENAAGQFMSATGPQRAKMVSSVVAPGLLVGTLANRVSSLGRIPPVSCIPPQFHKVVFKALEGKFGRLMCSIGKNGETLTVHVYRLSLADASIGDKTLYAGVLPLALGKFKELAREQGATKLLVQGQFANQRFEDVLKAKYTTHSEQPFLHKGAFPEGGDHCVHSYYENRQFLTFEIPLETK